jgi:hypothetical protein
MKLGRCLDRPDGQVDRDGLVPLVLILKGLDQCLNRSSINQGCFPRVFVMQSKQDRPSCGKLIVFCFTQGFKPILCCLSQFFNTKTLEVIFLLFSCKSLNFLGFMEEL